MRKRAYSAHFLAIIFALLLLGSAPSVFAGTYACGPAADGGDFQVLDGYNLPGGLTLTEFDKLSSLSFVGNCTIKNFPIDNGIGGFGVSSTLLNFNLPDKQAVIVLDNVYYTGNMACSNLPPGVVIWWVNGAWNSIDSKCQAFIPPLDGMKKENPVGATTQTIGVPFTYTLTMPEMVVLNPDGTYTWTGLADSADVSGVRITDDLTAASTGAELSYLGNTAYIKSGGVLTPIGSLNNLGDAKHLDFQYGGTVTAGDQLVVEVSVVLDNVPANSAGVQFVNTADWFLTKLVTNADGSITPITDVPGMDGVSQPMTIVEPNLIVTKLADTSTLNINQIANYTVDVQNIGGGDAWQTLIVDRLPAGMCDFDPRTAPVTLQLYDSGGVAVGAPLVSGADYTVSFTRVFSICFLNFTMQTSQAVIGPSQTLRITYQSTLDTDASQPADGAVLTNVAAATRWYGAQSTYAGRRQYSNIISNGSPGVADFQDDCPVTVTLSGYYFQKTVTNFTTGVNPATTAYAGDELLYTLHLTNLTESINNITISDLLPPAYFDMASFVATATPAGNLTFNSVTGNLTIDGFSLPPNTTPPAELIYEFRIRLRTDVPNGTVVSNQADLTANAGAFTLRSDDPNVNGIALPGDPNPDATTLTVNTPGALLKEATQTTATIGEQFTYRLTIPETPVNAPLYDVRIFDDLGASAADMQFVSATVVAGGAWTLTNSGTATAITLEEVVTGIDIPANGQAVIDITVQLQNSAPNQDALAFGNSAYYTYNRVNGVNNTQTAATSAAVSMSVVEPAITGLAKSFSFVSPASKTPTDAATAGEILEFVITIPSTGTSPAYDLNIVDVLPADLALVSGSAVAEINGLPVAGFVSAPITLPGGALNWGLGNADGSLDVLPSETLVLRYQATVASVSAASVSNSVTVDWTSLNGGVAQERTGSGCPTIVAPDDYCAGPVTTTIATTDNTRIQKSVISDSDAATPTGVLRIGDTVTYQLLLDIQENTTRNVVVEDLLPTGMALQSFAINAEANISYTMVSQPAAGATGTLRWSFGDISNPPSNNGTLIDNLTITYVARVVPTAPPVGIGHANSTLLSNQATLSYTGGDPLLDPARLSASVTVESRRPVMGPVTKVATNGAGLTGTGSALDPYQINIVTDVMQFRLNSCNTGIAPAYDVVITDLLASQLDQTDLITTPPVVQIDGVTQSAGTDYLFTAPPRGGEMRIALQDSAPVAPGSCVTVDYSIGFHSDLTVQSTFNNQALLREYATLPAGGRLYNTITPAEVWMTNIVNVQPLTKTLTSPASGEATIGELVEYRLVVPGLPMNVALNNVVVSDTLSGALTYLGASAVDTNNTPITLTDNSVLPGNVSLSIANIPAGQQAIITLRTQVQNSVANNAGVNFSNSASYTYTGIPVGSNTTGASGPLLIVEPLLTINKGVSSNVPRAGDILTYTVSINAAGGAPGDNFSNAYDVTVEDSLSLGLLYVPGSASLNGLALIDPATNGGDGVTIAQGLTWSFTGGADIDISEGTTGVISYRVRVLSAVGPGQDLFNSALARWSSLNGELPAVERTGSGTPTVNDYVTVPAVTLITVGDNTGVAKSVIGDSYPEVPTSTTEPVVRIGDTVTYQLRLELQEGTTQNVVVEDLLPPGLSIDSFNVIADPNFSYTLGVQPAAGDSGTLRWEFGDIQNTPSGDGTLVDSMFIEYVARVRIEAPPTGVGHAITALLDNQATLSYNTISGVLSLPVVTSTINVRRPLMDTVSKTETGGSFSGSGTLVDPYQVNIVSDLASFQLNTCNSGQAPAYGVVVSDQLAWEFDESTLTLPVVTIDGVVKNPGSDYLYTAPVARGGQLSITLQDAAGLAAGSCVTVGYRVGFHTDLTTQSTWSNQAIISEYWTLPASGRRYDNLTPGEVWLTNLVTVEPLTKTLLAPLTAEATIGEFVDYQIVVPGTPMNMALGNVVVSDTLHGALSYVSASAVDGGGAAVAMTDNSTAPTNVSLTIATIPAGEQVIISLRTRVANSVDANAGTSFSNVASYSYNGIVAGTNTSATSPPITITEPLIGLGKSVDNLSPAIGDLMTYSLTITASGSGGTGDNFSDAFDLTIEDSLGLGLLYEPGTAALDGVSIADPNTNGGDGVVTAQSLSWAPAGGVDIDLTEGQVATVTYQARVLNSVAPGQTLNNSALIRWSGLNGDQAAVERTGTGTPAVNDYITAPAVVIVATRVAVNLSKAVVNASTGEDPGANAAPGDTLSYILTLRNASVVAVNNVSLVDELSAEFEPGTLQLISIPAGADSSATDPTGGVNGTGIVDIQNISLAPLGSAGDTVTVNFTATLSQVLGSGVTVLNQALADSVDLLPTTSNQVSTLITSAPRFEILKSSADLTLDPLILLPNETIRYTITVRNTGTENTIGTTLRDVIPNYTTYVAGSTTLNGAPVTDPLGGGSPLAAGMLINSASTTTPGLLLADPTASIAASTATIVFDVTVDNGVLGGTFITNQAFLSGTGEGGAAFNLIPSDDPATGAINDPTRDVVGTIPLLDETKTVAIVVDNGTPGVADPGDTLRYTITTYNLGTVAATGVVLRDAVPVNTTYVANSTTLDGAPLGQPDGGVSPLVAGMTINASGNAAGTFDAGTNAVVTFDVQINAGVLPGTPISNQGFVSSNELATEPTDVDGDDSNGDQPTIIVVGSAQQLTIVKSVNVVGGGAALPGGELEYEVFVINIGSNPANSILISDDLNPLAGQVTYVAGSAYVSGSAIGPTSPLGTSAVTYSGGVLSVDYATAVGDLLPGEWVALRFRVAIDAALPAGTRITNTAQLQWNVPSFSLDSSASIDVGGVPGSASITGQAWHDVNFDNIFDATESPLVGWQVEVYLNNTYLGALTTDSTGTYGATGMAVTAGSDQYTLRFVAPGATTTTASLGLADSAYINGPQRISGVTGPWGSLVQGLNLPIDPNGVVFDSIVRTPVVGATLTMQRNGVALPNSCLDDPAQQGQVTLAGGHYKFDLNFSDPACPAGADYVINVIPPLGNDFEVGPSRVIPPVSNDPLFDPTALPYDVVTCSSDAVAVPAGYCEAMPNEQLPAAAIPYSSVSHYLYLTLNAPTPNDSQLFNNHIPVDPVLDNALTISKRSSMVNVTRGQLVPYTITINNTMPVTLTDLNIVDTFPPGFKYVSGSAKLNDVASEPVLANGTLTWGGLALDPGTVYTLKMLLIVGSGVSEGEYINRVQMFQTVINGAASGEASATVRVIPDPTFDCSDIIGKVFDDRNLNGVQDEGEKGLPGARVVSARGLLVTSDEHGRFHLTCAMVPDEVRGSNFILKLDDRTLPTGFRLTTENPRVQRLTRGKVAKFNFGATLHRVIRLDVADGVFEPGTTTMRPQWIPRIDLLLGELKKAPSQLRISYLADVESEGLVSDRMAMLNRLITTRWEEIDCCYKLTVESEIFWRRGAPPDRSRVVD